MSSSSGSYDTRRFYLCEPWSGQRGRAYKDRFMPDFLSGCMGKHDEFATWDQHLSGEVPGGILPASQQQLANNPTHVNMPRTHQGVAVEVRKSEAAFYNREAAILSAFRKHIPVEAISSRIDQLLQLHRTDDFAGGAPVTSVVVVLLNQGNVVPAHPVYAPNHPQAGLALNAYDLDAYQKCGNSLTRHIIHTIGLEAMPDPSSGLTQLDAETRWANLKLSVVGITPTTPRDLASHVSRLAIEVNANEQSKTIKYLSLFSNPAEIAQRATAELARCSEHLRKPDGTPDFLKIAREMQELWDVLVTRSKIEFKNISTGTSNSLNGFKLSLGADDEETYVMNGYALSSAASTGASVANEALCWNCFGFGHTKNDGQGNNMCPSERRFRKISDAALVLNSKATALNRGQPRGRGGMSNFRGGRGKGRGRGGPPGSHRPPPSANLLDNPSLDQAGIDEDGNVFSMDGTHLGSIAEAEDKSSKSTDEATEDKTADEFEDIEPERFEMSDFGSTSLGGNMFSLSIDDTQCPLCLDDDADMPKLVHDVDSDDDEHDDDECTPEPEIMHKKSSPLSCISHVLMCIAAAASGLATSLNGNRRVIATTAACLATGVDGTTTSGNSFAMSTSFATTGLSSVNWDAHIDSGTTVTASGRSNLFPPKLIKKWHPKFSVRSASQQVMPVKFVGTMVLKPADMPKKKKQGLMIENALYVPAMKTLTLVSPCQLYRSQGIKTYFNDENCLVLPDGSSINFSECNRSYILKIVPLDPEMMNYGHDDVIKFMSAECLEHCFKLSSDTPVVTPELIHRRCCHFSADRINASLSFITGLEDSGLTQVPRYFCHDCLRGGMKAPSVLPPRKKADSNRVAKPKSKEFGDLIWADTCSLPVSEPYGYIGWIAFLDDATRCIDLYFVRNHTSEEFTKCMQSFLTDNAEYLSKVDGKPRIKCLGTDNGTEFFSDDADKFLAELFTRHVAMPSFSPWQNPSERSHGIILRCIRVVHAEAGAPLKYWPFTAKQAAFVHNGLVTRSERVKFPGTSPYFMKTGKNADFTYLKCLYCNMTCFVRDKKESLTKIDIPTVEAIHFGIDHLRGGYYVYVPAWKRFSTFGFKECRAFETEYPSFDTEFSGGRDGINPPINGPALTDRAGNRTRGTGRRARRAVVAAAPNAAIVAAPIVAAPVVAAAPNAAANANLIMNETDALFVSLNNGFNTVLDKIGTDTFLCLNLDAVGGLPTPPRKTAEFDARPDGAEWWEGAQIEFDAKMANKTFELVERPKRGNVIKSGIVCSYKYDPITGALRDRNGHYVRWIAKGYSEIFGRDYFETYTATTKACGLRVFGAVVAAHDLDTCHIDDVKFFTQTPLPEPLLCEQMDGFVEGGYLPDGRSKLVCRLNKGLEGLKQSGNNAQVQCTAHLKGPCMLTQLVSEPTIFTRTFMLNGVLVFFILLVWIDDKWAAFSRGGYESILVPFLKVYNQRFKSTNSTGDVKRFIGLDITRNRLERTLSFSQEKYIAEFVPKFVDDLKTKVKKNMMPATATKPDSYHALYDLSLTVTESDRVDKPYLAAVASAMYAACMTRGDYAYYTSFLSQFSKLPFLKAWEALEQLLVSLYATRKQKLTYGGKVIKIPDAPTCSPPLNPSVIQKMFGLVIYSDASWKLGCTYAGFFILFCNAAVDWGALKLKVMLSSTEGEIAAGSHATRRIVYVRHLLGEILKLPKLPVTHIVDNSATPPLTEKMGASRKTEHFRRWQQFMRYAVVHGHSYVHLCSTRDQLADGLTKISNATQYLNMRAVMLNL